MNNRPFFLTIVVALSSFIPALAAEVPGAVTGVRAPDVTLPLWPAGHMPGQGAKEPEGIKPANDEFTRITNVSEPTISVYRAPHITGPAPAVLICPGGGYSYVVIDKEGSEIAAWLNTLGITGIVLKYRTPNNRVGAFEDGQRALRQVRAHSKEWNLNPAQIGAMGFSAGGHLCARLSTNFATASYPVIDEVDQQSCRPDFVVLVYPAYLGKDGQVASELPISDKIPPTLIVHSEDDRTFVAGSELYDAALTQAGVRHEYALYQTGGHGYALHCEREAKAWPQRCVDWLKKMQVAVRENVAPAAGGN